MSKLTREDVLRLAKLSRLELSESEVDQFAAEIGSILGYVKQLQDLDLGDVQPTYQVSGLKDVMREDEVIDYVAQNDHLLVNAPHLEDRHFKVKRMVG